VAPPQEAANAAQSLHPVTQPANLAGSADRDRRFGRPGLPVRPTNLAGSADQDRLGAPEGRAPRV
jgi:hypothetical protein